MFAPYQPCALIVDDDAAVRVSTAMLLSAMNVDCRLAENGQGALALVRKRYFDFALIDLGLPDIDGAALAEKMRAIAPAMAIVIVSTDYDRRARQWNVADYWLNKPMPPKLLQQTIREIMTVTPFAMSREVQLGGFT